MQQPFILNLPFARSNGAWVTNHILLKYTLLLSCD
jgi:hypothetical protein